MQVGTSFVEDLQKIQKLKMPSEVGTPEGILYKNPHIIRGSFPL